MYWRYLTNEIKRWSSKQYSSFPVRPQDRSQLRCRRFSHMRHCGLIYLILPREPAILLVLAQFVSECKALPRGKKPQVVVIIVPTVLLLSCAVQSLYDSDKTRWHFVLCGSSARKLRATGANLLPGRSVYHHLYSLGTVELGFKECPERSEHLFPVRLKQPAQSDSYELFPPTHIDTRNAL